MGVSARLLWIAPYTSNISDTADALPADVSYSYMYMYTCSGDEG